MQFAELTSRKGDILQRNKKNNMNGSYDPRPPEYQILNNVIEKLLMKKSLNVSDKERKRIEMETREINLCSSCVMMLGLSKYQDFMSKK